MEIRDAIIKEFRKQDIGFNEKVNIIGDDLDNVIECIETVFKQFGIENEVTNEGNIKIKYEDISEALIFSINDFVKFSDTIKNALKQ